MLNIIAELQEEIDKIEEVPKNDVEYSTIRFYDDSKGFERTVEALELPAPTFKEERNPSGKLFCWYNERSLVHYSTAMVEVRLFQESRQVGVVCIPEWDLKCEKIIKGDTK